MELSVPISKAKRALVVETEDFTPKQLEEALIEGLKVILNAKMTKIKTSEATEEEMPDLRIAAFTQAQMLADLNRIIDEQAA